MDNTRKGPNKFQGVEYLSNGAIAALKVNDVQKLKSLRECGESLALVDIRGNNLLHLAIPKRYLLSQEASLIEAFEYLLALPEINQDHLNDEGLSPLECSFFNPHCSEYAVALIESGCDLRIRFSYGNTVLHEAARNNWPEVVELLMEKGVDVDIPNEHQETALLVAAQRVQSTDIIWMLLFYGADPCLRGFGIVHVFHDIFSYLNFFDNLHLCGNTTLLHQFSKFYKTFSLSIFVKEMQYETNFYELLDTMDDIHYDNDDLDIFLGRIFALNSKMFEIFVQKFEFVVEDAFQKAKSLNEIFSCDKDSIFVDNDTVNKNVQNLCENLLILLKSNVASTVVDAFNKSELPLMKSLIECFNERENQQKMELLTGVLCCLLSYGVNMTPEAMNELYSSFGYCDLFKLMLHMNITEHNEALRHIWPSVIYDVQISFDDIIKCPYYDEATNNELSQYFTLPAFSHLRVPSLLELARNASRQFIVNRYKPKNNMQLFTVLYGLPIAEMHKEIISLERPLYSYLCSPRTKPCKATFRDCLLFLGGFV